MTKKKPRKTVHLSFNAEDRAMLADMAKRWKIPKTAVLRALMRVAYPCNYPRKPE
jgi:hypothetical protein